MNRRASNARSPRLRLADAARTELACLLLIDASSERTERMVREVEERLGIFIAVHEHHEAQMFSKRGAPASDALMELIRRLRLIFRRHYRGRRSGRRSQGAVQFLGTEEEQELRFAHVALCADGLRYRGRQSLLGEHGPRHLAKLFRDLRCTPPTTDGRRPGSFELVLERTQAIGRMALKVSRRRQVGSALAAKIEQQKLSRSFTAREVMRKGWRHLRTATAVNLAIECLVGEGWLLVVERPTATKGGRPTTKYQIVSRR